MLNNFFKLLTVIFIITGIAACSGGGDSSDPVVIDDPVVPEVQILKSVTGVYADDMPIARAEISVIDAEGVTREVTTDDNGLYYVDVSELKLPLLIVGSYTLNSLVHTEYSFVSADKASDETVTANINDYSTLLVNSMMQEAGVVMDIAPELQDEANRNLMLGVDYLPAIASMEELFCSVLVYSDGTLQGCEWGSSEDFLTTSYVPTLDGTSIDRLVALIDVTVDTTTGDIIIADSTGVPVVTISLDEIVTDTIPADTLTPADIDNINTYYTPPEEVIPVENEDMQLQLTTSGTVTGVTKYVSVFPMTQVFVDNLTECPVESRNFVVTPGENAQTPIVHFAEYQLEMDTSPEFVPAVSRTSISPVDACRSYAFDYQFDYNMVIRKTQTGLVDGVPVWEYDVPACEQYSNKAVEDIYQKTYQYTDVDFDLLFNFPTIVVRPALHRYTESWPDSSVDFVYDPTCLMVAEFSVSPIQGTPSLTVNVDASNSVGNLVSYEWETTDGQTATGLTASFTFDTAGSYTITLTVTDSNGQTDVLSKIVTVDSLPQAAFTSTLGSALNTVGLNAVNSTGVGISYSWSTSDGQTATGQNVEFTFATSGDYTITLKVRDKYGNTNTTSKVVTVNVDIPPHASFTWLVGSSSLEIFVDGSFSSGTGISYQWTTSDGQSATGQTAGFTFGAAGNYQVTLTVTDGNNKTSFVTQGIVVTEPEYSLVGNWCRPDFRMCIDILPSTDYAIVTSYDSNVYSGGYIVQVGETKYQNIAKVGSNEYGADSKVWQSDGTSYWKSSTLNILDGGLEIDAGSINWLKQ